MINNSMNKIAIYPGRFHPFHKGHQASYQYLQNQFGADNVFIGTSNVVAPLTSPFSFEDKKQMMTMLGIPEDKIVQVKNPYRSEEITAKLDPDNTVLIFGLSEKDVSRFTFTKKDGSKSYMQPYPKDEMQLKSMKDHAYVVLTPTIDFRVGGDTIKSASQIRSMYIKADDTQRRLIIKDMYGKADSKIKELFDKKLGIAESLSLLLTTLKESKDVANIRKIELALEMEKTAKQIEERDLDEDVINIGSGFRMTEPQFDVEWEEANRYPYLEKLGKEGWIKLAQTKGEPFMITSTNVGKIANTDAADPDSFEQLEVAKKLRFDDAIKLGRVEMPIVMVKPRSEGGGLELIAGNTRLTGLMAMQGYAMVWLFSAGHLDA